MEERRRPYAGLEDDNDFKKPFPNLLLRAPLGTRGQNHIRVEVIAGAEVGFEPSNVYDEGWLSAEPDLLLSDAYLLAGTVDGAVTVANVPVQLVDAIELAASGGAGAG